MVDSEEAKALAQAEKAAKKRKSTSPLRDGRRNKAQKANGNDLSNGTRTPAGEDWELACEICLRQGFNLVRPPLPRVYLHSDCYYRMIVLL